MTNPIGPYWSVMHRRPTDYAYFERLQPAAFKIMDGGPPDYAWMREHTRNSLVLARDWALSEQHADMLKDPAATGHRHAQEWRQHADRLGFDRANTLVLGINEPRVWEPGVPEALRVYTIALCDEGTRLGLRVGALQFAVGWPGNIGPDTPPNWEPYRGVDNAIRRNNGALICHEYWADNGPQENWGWWAGRSLKCPWDVPLIIGECGIDMHVKDGAVAHETRGWRGRKSPEQYASELADYAGRMSADKRFRGCCVFTCDYANREWMSFDVEPAYQAILATPIPVYPPTGPGQTTTAPDAAPQSGVGYVSVPAGANLRTAPDLETGDVLVAVPYGEPVELGGFDTGSDGQPWARTRYQSYGGWIRADLLSAEAPVAEPPTPPTPPAGDNWRRALDFVLRWEGGFANHPNDPGGPTNKGITIGTLTRWRQSQGKPQPTVEDLRNISDAEVEAIYRDWYWQASGADKLPWPLALAHMDTAVNAGVGRAQEMLAKSRGNFLAYMGHLIDWYTRIDNFEHFGRAWIRRRAELLLEASK